jgi:hypothetical protein
VRVWFVSTHRSEPILGKRQATKPESPSSEKVRVVLESQLSSVQSGLRSPVCRSEVELNLRSKIIRTGEVSVLCIEVIFYINFIT